MTSYELISQANRRYDEMIKGRKSSMPKTAWACGYIEGWMEARAKQLNLALQSLTPGGSEFVNDPDRCVAFVRQARDGEMQALRAAVKRAQEAEARVERERRHRKWALKQARFQTKR